MALAFTGRADDPDTTNTTAFAVPSFTPSANAAIYVGVLSAGNGATAPTPTLDTPSWLTGAGWTNEGNIEHSSGSTHMKLTVFSGFTTASPGADDLTATHSPAVSGCHIQVVEATGADLTDSVVQIKTAEGSTVSSLSATFDGALGSSNNACLAFIAHNTAEAQAPTGSESEVYDSGHASPNRRMSVQYEINDNDSGANWATPSDAVIFMLEVKQAGGGGTINPAGTITPAGALTKVATLARSFGGTLTPAGALTFAGQIAFPASDVSDDTVGDPTLQITPFSGSTTYAAAVASEPASTSDYSDHHIEVQYSGGTGFVEVIMQLDPLDEPLSGDCTIWAWHNNPVDGDVQIINGDDSSVVGTMGLLPVQDDYGSEWSIQSEDFTPGDLEPVHDWGDLQLRFYQADDGGSFFGSGGLTYAYLETPAAAGGGDDFFITPAGTITPAGVLRRAASKTFVGVITPAGVLAKVATLARALAGTITPAGSLIKAVAKSFAGAITGAGSLSNNYTPGGGGGASYFITPAGTITPAGAITKVLTAARALGGTITPAATLAKVATLARSLAGTVTPAGALAKAISKTFAGTITPAGALTRVRNYARSLGGTITPTGALLKGQVLFRTFTGTITPRGTLTKYLNGVLIFFGFIDHVPTTDLTLADHNGDVLTLTDHDANQLTLTDHTPTMSEG